MVRPVPGGGGADRSANPTPGNKAGDWSTSWRRRWGPPSSRARARSPRCWRRGAGDGEGPDLRGDAASDFICGTLQLASGMTLQVFTTRARHTLRSGRGPVIKVATRSDLAARWHDLIDLDAGRIATGEATVEEVGWELFRMILEVASGTRKPWSDQWACTTRSRSSTPRR